MILDHTDPWYQRRLRRLGPEKYNGAYFYSKEIVETMIPLIDTDRGWVTVDLQRRVPDHSIVFIHNNKQQYRYRYLLNSKDLILVCGIPQTAKVMQRYGNAIYLPLSVDVEYVEKFSTGKTKDTAFAGRPSKAENLPEGTDILGGLPRESLLKEMAKYRNIYAVGRTALEAKVLGCNILSYDRRFPNPSIWKVLDTKDAAKILQEKLRKIEQGEFVV